MLEIIPDVKNIEGYVELASKYSFAFEYNDFYKPGLLDDKDKVNERIKFYKSLGRDTSQDTLHGAFFDTIHFSSDSKIRRIAFERMLQCVEIAEELSCRGVVFHTNFNPAFLNKEVYVNQWLEYSEKVVMELISASSNVEIYFENMFDESPVQLKMLVDNLADVERFGVCLDIAHMILGNVEAEQWFEQLAPAIKHFHLNDNFLEHDDHLPLGAGRIDWRNIFWLMDKYNLSDASRLFEVTGLDAINRSFDFYRKNIIQDTIGA